MSSKQQRHREAWGSEKYCLYHNVCVLIHLSKFTEWTIPRVNHNVLSYGL